MGRQYTLESSPEDTPRVVELQASLRFVRRKRPTKASEQIARVNTPIVRGAEGLGRNLMFQLPLAEEHLESRTMEISSPIRGLSEGYFAVTLA